MPEPLPIRDGKTPANQTGVAWDVPVQWPAHWSVKQWANDRGLGVRQFEKTFKAEKGIPPKQWIDHWRLLAAVDRLVKGDSIKGIVIQFGYCDAVDFCRVFQKAFVISPKRFMVAFNNLDNKVLSIFEFAFIQISSLLFKKDRLTDTTNPPYQSNSDALSQVPGVDNGQTSQAKNKLTKRENEIMGLIGKGFGNKKIAELTQLQENTVEWYLQRIFRKLNVHNRTEALIFLCKSSVADSRSNPYTPTTDFRG